MSTISHISTATPAIMPPHLVLNNVGLMTLIFNYLALSSLIKFAYLSKANHVWVLHYVKQKISNVVDTFGIPIEDLMTMLYKARAVIVGSVALKVVAPAVMPITPNGLDIVMEIGYETHFKRWLMRQHGYRRVLIPILTFPPSTPFIKYCFSFERDMGNNRFAVINLILVYRQGQVYEFAYHSPNTAMMNMLFPQGPFVAYRALLDDQKAVRNDSYRIRRLYGIDASAEQHQKIHNFLSNMKLERRGFTFVPRERIPHPINFCNCCPYKSACPLTIRDSNDTMCCFFPISYEDNLVTTIASSLTPSVILRRRPSLIWMLPDEFGRQKGFVQFLRYGTISMIKHVLDI